MTITLLDVEQEFLDSINIFYGTHGYFPSLRDMSQLTGRGRTRCQHYVRILELKNKLTRNPHGSIIATDKFHFFSLSPPSHGRKKSPVA